MASLSVSAPGKVILHGEYSVVCGKTAIAASLDMRTKVNIQERTNDEKPQIYITLNSFKPTIKTAFNIATLKTEIEVPLLKDSTFDKQSPNTMEHTKYFLNVTKYVEKHLTESKVNLKDNEIQALVIVVFLFCGITNKSNYEQTSFDLTVTSELTIGAGTGSSASYAVCLTAAFLKYHQFKGKMATDLKGFTLQEKKLISDWAFSSEKIAHGTPSGVDNAVCTFGSLVEFRKGNEPVLYPLDSELKIILVDTCVSRQTKVLVHKFMGFMERHKKPVDKILEAFDEVALSALEVLQVMDAGDTESQLANFKKLSELFDLNHHLLAGVGASHPSLEKIRSIAAQHGYSSKLTGAGGGGYAIILVQATDESTQLDPLLEDLKDSGFKPQLTKLGGPGVAVDSFTI